MTNREVVTGYKLSGGPERVTGGLASVTVGFKIDTGIQGQDPLCLLSTPGLQQGVPWRRCLFLKFIVEPFIHKLLGKLQKKFFKKNVAAKL